MNIEQFAQKVKEELKKVNERITSIEAEIKTLKEITESLATEKLDNDDDW